MTTSRSSWLRQLTGFACASLFACAHAAPITVDSLADDVFPNAAGAIFDINDLPVVLGAPKCTLRMAIAAANLDIAVGGANGCEAGSGPDVISFAATLNLPATPGTITLADRAMSEAPAVYAPPAIIQPALIVSRPLTITGPGSSFLTIDGGVPGNSGRRLLNVSDGSGATDSPFQISGVRLLRGRALEQAAGCMFSSDSVTITDVVFESCESVGGPTQGGHGGALGVGNMAADPIRPDVTVSNSVFLSNRSTRGTSTDALPQAGAAFFGSGMRKVGKVTITNTRFLGNSAESVGALLVRDASAAAGDSVTLNNAQFLSNSATGTVGFLNGGRYGGFQITQTTGNINIANVGVVGNTANQERGGFSITTVSGTTTITDTSVLGNVAVLGRVGGFDVLTDNFDANGNCLGTSKNPVNIFGVAVVMNSAATNTGGFRVVCSGNVSIGASEIANNEVYGSPVAGSGGNSAGQLNTNLAVTMADVVVKNNRTDAGAVDGGFGVFTVFDNTSFDGTRLLFRENRAQQNEAGLTLRANGAGRNYTVTNSSFVDNFTNQLVSAIYLDRTGNYTVKNSTFSGNRSSFSGAININMNAASGSNAVLLENVTGARNAGSNLAIEVFTFGMPSTPNGTVIIKNTLLASGVTGPGVASASLQTLPNVTYVVSNSLIENSTVGVPAGICGVNGNKCNVDARLENVARNNALTTLTHALKPGSPALDAGAATALVEDQRGMGFPRQVGTAVDIGAFESQALPPICTLDVDGNNAIDALTDGLVLIRAMFGLTGTPATTNAIGGGATRTTWAMIQPYLNGSCGASFAP